MIAISAQARELSDEELSRVVELALKTLRELQDARIWSSARGVEAERMLRAARREQERRNALASKVVQWDVLLQALPPDDFLGSVTASALQPFDIFLHEGRFFAKTGQYVLALRMIQDEADQVERVARGLESLGLYVSPLRHGEWDVAVEHFRARARSRKYFTIRANGTTALEDAEFPDLRTGLRAIQESHYWRQTRPSD